MPTVSCEEGSALRTGLGLSWNKFRKHRKCLRSKGVKVDSEHKEREFQKSIQCGDIVVEHKLFECHGKEESMPVGYRGHDNLSSFVQCLLSSRPV